MEYHLLKADGEWHFREANSPDALFSAETKLEAMDRMQDYMESRDGDVMIHKANGEFQSQRRYASEPETATVSPTVRNWGIFGVVAVAAITAASVVWYYRGSIPVDRLRQLSRYR